MYRTKYYDSNFTHFAKFLESESKKGRKKIQSSIIALQDSHPRRAHFGELIQMDTSKHKWFANIKTQLHVTIDDATGKILVFILIMKRLYRDIITFYTKS